MHKHTIDWLSDVFLTREPAIAERHWKTATTLAEKPSRSHVIDLLRLFLFPQSSSEFMNRFTDELIQLDVQFKVKDNCEHLRLMAGLVMVASFEKPSCAGDAFALGILAASFPDKRIQPVQPGMVSEAEKYLVDEAERVRPAELDDEPAEVTRGLSSKRKIMVEAMASDDEEKQKAANEAFQKSLVETISESYKKLAARLGQLGEESGLLWWVLNEYSDDLKQPLAGLTPEAYALVAAFEASKRTQLLPPPPCIDSLISRSLKSCKPGKKRLVLADYLEASVAGWRFGLLKSIVMTDCRDLVPICSGLEKTEEIGDVDAVSKALTKLCPGVKGDLSLTPGRAGRPVLQ
jgi:hypothetical protein